MPPYVLGDEDINFLGQRVQTVLQEVLQGMQP
jgi:hypothetical protein